MTELEKRILRYFFAEEKLFSNMEDHEHSVFWLKEMAFNKNWIKKDIDKREKAEADKTQLKLFK